MKLFVYGTLRRGQSAHALLKGAPLLGEARTEPRFTLVDMGGYPALIEGGDTAVLGEIYEISADLLTELDRYEEAPQLYRRVAIRIAGHDAVTYTLPAQHAQGRPPVPTGDWSPRPA